MNTTMNPRLPLWGLLWLCATTALSAQQLPPKPWYDINWLTGYSSNPTRLDYGGTVIRFDSVPPRVYYQFRGMNFSDCNANISDRNGKLLFYTNGIYIANANHDTLKGGNILPFGDDFKTYAPYGLPLSQGGVFLPWPGDDDKYILLHNSYDIIYKPNGDILDFASRNLYYTILDRRLDNGLGAVVEYSRLLVQDTLESGQITACRHANGRDWWIIKNKFFSNKYFRFLLTPKGFIPQGVQVVGAPVDNGLGQSVFSPDGTKYARLNLDKLNSPAYIDLYDFDRCAGLLSNHRRILVDKYGQTVSAGLAFSPNSRFLYATAYKYVLQYDLTGPAGQQLDTVATYDGFTAPLPTRFYLAQLAPDGKIYFSASNSSNILHVIHEPDKKGLACRVEQHGVKLPTYMAFGLPNHPNYRLGALAGSPCDTVRTATDDLALAMSWLRVFPNPTAGNLRLAWGSALREPARVCLYDLTGRLVRTAALPPGQQEYDLDLYDLPPGIYAYAVYAGEHVVAGKVVRM